MKAKLSQLQFKDIQILKFNLEENIEGKKKFNIDLDFEPVKVNIDNKEYDGLVVSLNVNNRNRNVKLKVSIEVLAIFEIDENLPETKKAQLLLYNGLSIVYGFLRGIIFQKCSYINPSDRILPSINLLKLIEEKLEKENNEKL